MGEIDLLARGTVGPGPKGPFLDRAAAGVLLLLLQHSAACSTY